MCESWGGCACDYAKFRITNGRATSEATKSKPVSLAPETLSPLSPSWSRQHLFITELSHILPSHINPMLLTSHTRDKVKPREYGNGDMAHKCYDCYHCPVQQAEEHMHQKRHPDKLKLGFFTPSRNPINSIIPMEKGSCRRGKKNAQQN